MLRLSYLLLFFVQAIGLLPLSGVKPPGGTVRAGRIAHLNIAQTQGLGNATFCRATKCRTLFLSSLTGNYSTAEGPRGRVLWWTSLILALIGRYRGAGSAFNGNRAIARLAR